MDEKGYVVCLLKYVIGTETDNCETLDSQSSNKKSVCFGHFGRVDVMSVQHFKDYMKIASENDAEFVGSRKQLLIYSLSDELSGQIKLRKTESASPTSEEKNKEKNCLPFCPAEGDKHPSLCCLSVLKINNDIKKQLGNNWLRIASQRIFEQINLYKQEKGIWMPCILMGLLGTEDLCMILLSNSFGQISNVVDRLQGLVDQNSQKIIVENSHSILMADFSNQADVPKWDDANAEIYVSLKTTDGWGYLKKICKAITNTIANQPENPAVILESRPGEYDAVIRCPASALGSYLYGYGGLLNYANQEYREAAYQSETVLSRAYSPTSHANIELTKQDCSATCQAGETPQEEPSQEEPSQEEPSQEEPSQEEPSQEELSQEEPPQESQDMKKLVEEAIKQINQSVLGTKEDPKGDLMYIRLSLHRLLKDFMRIESLPFGGTLQYDLRLQFQGAVNAIVCAAEEYKIRKPAGRIAKKLFDKTLSGVMNALSNSVQAASQIDQLCFREQQSHLQNTGAYHKILLVYYGIVKDILQLIYSLPRTENSREAILIPLLSFGHTPVISSTFYPSSYDGKAAKLVCIIMPYQALTNIPKYIGILVHELFHYSTPADRNAKNETAGLCLAAMAFRQFLNVMKHDNTNHTDVSVKPGEIVFNRCKREFLETARMMFHTIQKNQNSQSYDYAKTAGTLPSVPFFATLFDGLLPTVDPPLDQAIEELYCKAWVHLRKELLKKKNISHEISALFSLQEKDWKDDEAYAHIREIYWRTLPYARQRVRAYLNVYIKVLLELPPDLFDIGCVMYGQNEDLKARQYLWQIHSIRSDKLYDNNVFQKTIDGNAVRTGIILDHLLFGPFDPNHYFKSPEKRKQQMNDRICKWFHTKDGEETAQAKEAEKLRHYAETNYANYISEGLFASILLENYINPITDQIQRLSEGEKTPAIMERLSNFYREYYQTLDDKTGEEQVNALFRLSLRMIEYYQLQPTLVELCEICEQGPELSTEGAAISIIPEMPKINYEAEVSRPGELFQKIVSVYNIMIPNGISSPLWFRGERLENRKLLPTIMRDDKKTFSKNGFLAGMRRTLTLAKAKILPQGTEFHKAEWLSLLQHYQFRTNLLDWSEDLHSALFFAIEKWIEEGPDKAEEGDAAIYILNPILFNLAHDFLEKYSNTRTARSKAKKAKTDYQKALDRLSSYLKNDPDKSNDYTIPLFTTSEEENDRLYRCYFDLTIDDKITDGKVKFPIAAMTPANNERMKMQTGVFTFFDIRSKPKKNGGKLTYEGNDLINIQKKYFNAARIVLNTEPLPFLYKIILNHLNAREFVQYVKAVGIRKYKMYPEIDKLADDIQTFYN